MRTKPFFPAILAILFGTSVTLLNAGGWGTGGVVQTDLGGTDLANVVVVQPDGKVLAAGQSDEDMVIVRYNPNGTLDDSFGDDGVVRVVYPLGWSVANDLLVLEDGKIIVLGTTYNTSTTDIALVKINSNGTLDSTFAAGGKLRFDYKARDNYGDQIVLKNGYLHILEGTNRTVVHKFTLDGQSESVNESYAAANGYGLYINDNGNGRVSAVTYPALNAIGYWLNSEDGSSDLLYDFSGNYPYYFDGGMSKKIKIDNSGNYAFMYWSHYARQERPGNQTHYYLKIHINGKDQNIKVYSEVAGTPQDPEDFKGTMAWVSDGKFYVSAGTQIQKRNLDLQLVNPPKDTSFGIGGVIETSYSSKDLVAYDENRILQNADHEDDFYLAVYNSDGSPYVAAPPSITSSTSVDGEVQVLLEYLIVATNSPTNYSATSLPPGLSLDTSSGLPKVVGTPTQSGTFVATISATNSGGTSDAQVTFEIAKTSQTITFNNPGAQVLGALPFEADVFSSSGLPVQVSVDSGPVTVIDNTLYLTGVGLATLTASQAGSDDYEAANDVSLAFSIVSIAEHPTILTNPSNANPTVAGSAVFTVSAAGPQPYLYQWFKNGEELESQTSSVLAINNVGYFDEAVYTCRVSNSFGDTLSLGGALNVTIDSNGTDSDGDGISDQVEMYLAPFGFDPNSDSAPALERLQAMVSKLELGDGYTAEQMRELALGAPVIQRLEDGDFSLKMDLLISDDLETWNVHTLQATDVGTESGSLEVKLDPTDAEAQFYKIRVENN